MRQGAILSPLLYSVFVDQLLVTLSQSGYGATVNKIYCGAPMYADDLALIGETPEELQAMLDIAVTYASRWRYAFNLGKSHVMVFGESTRSRMEARKHRKWHLGERVIAETDELHHLGVLHTEAHSTVSCTAERSTSGRSAFFALNAVVSRFGCLHPITSHRLYSALSLPIMLYGAELLCLTATELMLLE